MSSYLNSQKNNKISLRIPLYEFPLNNRIRLFLRHEYLAQSIEYGLGTEGIAKGTRKEDSKGDGITIDTLSSLFQIIEINTRNDIRGEIMQHIGWQCDQLRLLQKKPEVNQTRLKHQLDRYQRALGEIETFKLSMPSYHNHHFFNAIKHRLSTPGGLASFNIPMFTTWLERSPQRKQSDIESWYAPFKALHKSIGDILELSRQSQEFSDCRAEAGFYKKNFSSGGALYQLVRIAVSPDVFPEISASQSYLTIYFSLLDELHTRPKQTKHAVNFKLALCHL